MKGMVLELDNDVWLLLTDQLHTMIHGLRVGSIVSEVNLVFYIPDMFNDEFLMRFCFIL
jgi:hypothetical protein